METENNNKKYEIGLLFTTEEAIPSVIEAINKAGAKVEKQDTAKKITLAYKIEKHSEAFFAPIYIDANPDSIIQISNDLKFISGVIRFLIIKPDLKAEKEAKKAKEEKPKTDPKPTDEKEESEVSEKVVEVKDVPEKALSNEALEKKLEEILK